MIAGVPRYGWRMPSITPRAGKKVGAPWACLGASKRAVPV